MKAKDERQEPAGTIDRRDFLKMVGATLAMAGLSSCTRQAPEAIVPYAYAPEQIIPGMPLFYATTMPLQGYAFGVLAETHMGHPTKLEGNTRHPASLGAISAPVQASLLDLYDPDRPKEVTRRGNVSSWGVFQEALLQQLQQELSRGGDGLRIVIGATTSPASGWLMRSLRQKFPRMKYCVHEPLGQGQVIEGLRRVVGRPAQAVYDFSKAACVVSFDSDFLFEGPASVNAAISFSLLRKPRKANMRMNRLFVAEPTPTVTGSIADYRLPARFGRVPRLIQALASMLGGTLRPPEEFSPEERAWLQRAGHDLRRAKRRGLVVAGFRQPPEVHAAVAQLNATLDAAAVRYIEPVESVPGWEGLSWADLAHEIQQGMVKSLIVLETNPLYAAPRHAELADMFPRLEFSACLSLYRHETAAACAYHIPQAHYLEAWGDLRAFDGTSSLTQPAIAPLFGGKTPHEFLWLMLRGSERNAYDIVREAWAVEHGSRAEEVWNKALSIGVLTDSAAPSLGVSPDPASAIELKGLPETTGLEAVFSPDPYLLDGRAANNQWLQELPRPLSLLTWENAVCLAPATAKEIGIREGEVISVRVDGKSCEAPVMLLPGHAPGSITLFFAYGRKTGAPVVEGKGYDAFALWPKDGAFAVSDVAIASTGRMVMLPVSRAIRGEHGRDLVKTAGLPVFKRNPAFAEGETKEESLYPPYERGRYEWAMVIDLSSCIGCHACTMACQAENNIPVVGKGEVLRSRIMHWIRVDTYFEGSTDNPAFLHQPVPCMQCETAPCEVVCPTAATTHSTEGLNQMVYNRCVGTRYCSNNCPYKVRRFNFFGYSYGKDNLLELSKNPDVTVRERGVMEKCTYCIQRISKARIDAEKENRLIREGEVMPACAAACPTRTIYFGNLSDAKSAVTALRGEPHNYGLLAELGTRPRTTYMAKIRNVDEEKLV